MPEGLLSQLTPTFEKEIKSFYNLMRYRVQNILLVSSLYDSYIIEQEGRLTELIFSEYVSLNLRFAPRVQQVAKAESALEAIRDKSIDLVITMPQIGDMDAYKFGSEVKKIRPNLPVIMLCYNSPALSRMLAQKGNNAIDKAFVWQGDAIIFLAIIKYIEDRMNVKRDVETAGVQVIILIEDSVKFYSIYLPLIYSEIVKQMQGLLSDDLTMAHRLVRMRARPKIILADSYEEAKKYFYRYHENVLGIISDVSFPKNDVVDPEAGLKFARMARKKYDDIPILLQSSNKAHEASAREANVSFLYKYTPTLLQELREFILENFGFGDFVFHMPDGTEVARAKDLRELEKVLADVPDQSIEYHASRNHFSNFLKARSEFTIASLLRPRKVSEFKDIDEMRHHLIHVLATLREEKERGAVAVFSRGNVDQNVVVTRIRSGSLGGKARGLAFFNAFLAENKVQEKFRDVRIKIPAATVVGTDVFDEFMDKNQLLPLVINENDDEIIARLFLKARLPRSVLSDLRAFITQIRHPLAVRSSSLLEDSQFQPFSGVYKTYMIPNNDPSVDVRLNHLARAIKLIYASLFFSNAKAHIRASHYRIEDEKLAVILQKVVGKRYGKYFYPNFSGVARSVNYYPVANMEAQDGIASTALGLGKWVVEGGESLRFSPAWPQSLPQFASAKDYLNNTQRRFFALRMDSNKKPGMDDSANLALLGLSDAEKDGTLDRIGSVYSPEDDKIYDGIHRPGPRIINFAHILKYNTFPLSEILRELLKLGRKGMNCPVELEFAVNLNLGKSKKPEFNLLQIRPFVMQMDMEEITLDDVNEKEVVCYSTEALGNGIIKNVRDFLYVKPERFDSKFTKQIASEVERINDKIAHADNNGGYILMGPGRWGSVDPWLGIPVSWRQIYATRLVVETELKEWKVTPSQGTHFFQNLISYNIGYFTINPSIGEGLVNYQWLNAQHVIEETNFVRHIRLEKPFRIYIDGKGGRGVILVPESEIPENAR